MSKPFEQRNQSAKAIRKLKSLAKTSGLDLTLVTTLANFTWDYDPDPHFPREVTGWVKNEDLPDAAADQLRSVAESLGLSAAIQLSRVEAGEQLLLALEQPAKSELWLNFVAAATSKNRGHVSEFASAHYLRGATQAKLQSLDWRKGSLDIQAIARSLFLKFFRGGAVDRCNLGYLWCDLTIPPQYTLPTRNARTDWIHELLNRIEALPGGSRLKDLLACCKGLVGGNKGFRQGVLDALAYADVIRVNGLPVTEMFIPERRNELSSHFYSNEWSFPLRFWSANGGTVNRSAVPEIK